MKIFYILLLFFFSNIQMKSDYSNIYDVINAAIPDDGSKRIFVYKYPINMASHLDDKFKLLIDRELINKDDIFYMKSQFVVEGFVWDDNEVDNARVVGRISKCKKRGINTYALAVPVFNKANNISIVYLRSMGRNSIFESIDVYEKRGSNWYYKTNIFSVIGS